MRHRPIRPVAVLLVAGLLLMACGDDADDVAAAPDETTASDESATTDDTEPAGDGPVTIVAVDVQFEPDELSVPVGSVDFVIDNQDDGIPHNFHVEGEGVDETTELEKGPVTQELTVDFPAAGTYEFICDIHPAMKGTVEVG